jgi:glycosyltransferase involved in cell wall biosynthesis
MAPLVSVVVTTYNHAPYILAALKSVLDQTWRDYELIVVDDGSTDGTLDEIARCPGPVSLLAKKGQGVAGSRNAGIREARGDLLAFLDGDDLWEPDKLTHQVAAAHEYPRAGLIAVNGIQFCGGDIRLESLLFPPVTERLRGRDSVTLRCYEDLLRHNLIATTSQVMIRRAVLDAVGFSDLRFPVSSDWDLYIRIAESYEMTFLSKRLTRWRYLATSASGPERLRPLRWGPDEIEILKKHLHSARAPYRPLIRALLKEKITNVANATYVYGREVDIVWARGQLLALLRRNPTSRVLAMLLVASWLPYSLTKAVRRSLRPARRRPYPNR